jgi:hypothetical protein
MHNVKLLPKLVELPFDINFGSHLFLSSSYKRTHLEVKRNHCFVFFLVLNFIFHNLFFLFFGVVELKGISWC